MLKYKMNDVFSGWNASSQLQLQTLEVSKLKERYAWSFWRINNGNKYTTSAFICYKLISKVCLMHLDGKLQNRHF